MSTLIVPSNVFALEEDVKDLDELVNIIKTPLEQSPTSYNLEGEEKKYIIVFKEKPNKKDLDNVKSVG